MYGIDHKLFVYQIEKKRLTIRAIYLFRVFIAHYRIKDMLHRYSPALDLKS